MPGVSKVTLVTFAASHGEGVRRMLAQLRRDCHAIDQRVDSQPDRRRRRRPADLPVRGDEPRPAASAAVSRHRAAEHLDLHRLASGFARGNRGRVARAAGAGPAGSAGRRGDRGQRQYRRQLHQPDLRHRHRHAFGPGRRDRAHEPGPLAAGRRRPADHPARRWPERLQRLAVVVLRATAARHRRADRELPQLHRGRDPAAHRIGARGGLGQRQFGPARRPAHHRGPGQGCGLRHRHPGNRPARDPRDRRLGRADRPRPPAIHPTLHRSLQGRRPRRPGLGLARRAPDQAR